MPMDRLDDKWSPAWAMVLNIKAEKRDSYIRRGRGKDHPQAIKIVTIMWWVIRRGKYPLAISDVTTTWRIFEAVGICGHIAPGKLASLEVCTIKQMVILKFRGLGHAKIISLKKFWQALLRYGNPDMVIFWNLEIQISNSNPCTKPDIQFESILIFRVSI